MRISTLSTLQPKLYLSLHLSQKVKRPTRSGPCPESVICHRQHRLPFVRSPGIDQHRTTVPALKFPLSMSERHFNSHCHLQKPIWKRHHQTWIVQHLPDGPRQCSSDAPSPPVFDADPHLTRPQFAPGNQLAFPDSTQRPECLLPHPAASCTWI